MTSSPPSALTSAQPSRELWALCLWLAVLPLLLGVARTWALALALPPLFAIALVVAWRRRIPLAASLPAFLVRSPGFWLLLFMALLAAQLLPLGVPVSVAPYRTWLYLTVALGCAVLFWLAVALVRSQGDLKLLLNVLMASGALQAGIALFLLVAQAPLPTGDTTIARAEATGTFADQGHLAAYLSMCLAAGIGLLMGRFAGGRSAHSWHERLRGWVELPGRDKLGLRLLPVLMMALTMIALVLTRSWIGNASFFLGLLASASIYAVLTRERRHGLLVFAASVILIDLVLIGAWVGVDHAVRRVLEPPVKGQLAVQAPEATVDGADGLATGSVGGANGETDTAATTRLGRGAPLWRLALGKTDAAASMEARNAPVLEALPLLRDHFWLGTGAGTFRLVFMQYAPPARVPYDHAYNDYFEIATDTGVMGLIALVGLAVSSLVASLQILRHRRNQVARAAAFASLMALACLAMQSLVDFNLQIPANAMMLSLMAALPFAAGNIPSAKQQQRRRHRGERMSPALESALHALRGEDARTPGEDGRARGKDSGARAEDGRASGDAAAGARGRRDAADVLPGVALAALATLLLVWGIWTAGRFGVADHLSRRADQRIALLAAQATPASVESLGALQALIVPAIMAAPEVADYYETLGAAWFAMGDSAGRPQAQSRADFGEAVVHFREAARRSRASGYAWAGLMLAKHRAGEIDDEFHEALRKAVRHAPREPNVQVMVVEAGLGNWTQLRGDERRLVLLTLQRGWPANAAGFLREAAAVPGMDEWCIEGATEAEALCAALRERAARN